MCVHTCVLYSQTPFLRTYAPQLDQKQSYAFQIERFKSDHGVGVVREMEGEDAAGSVPPLGYASVALPFLCLAAGAAAAAAVNAAEKVFTKKSTS